MTLRQLMPSRRPPARSDSHHSLNPNFHTEPRAEQSARGLFIATSTARALQGAANIKAHGRGRQTISPQCRRDSAETGGNAIKFSEPGGVDEGRQTIARSEA